MIKKFLKYCLFIFVILLFIGIGLQFYISQPIETKELMCHKGRLIHRIGDTGSVYLKVKGVSCVFERGIIIIEEQS